MNGKLKRKEKRKMKKKTPTHPMGETDENISAGKIPSQSFAVFFFPFFIFLSLKLFIFIFLFIEKQIELLVIYQRENNHFTTLVSFFFVCFSLSTSTHTFFAPYAPPSLIPFTYLSTLSLFLFLYEKSFNFNSLPDFKSWVSFFF